MDWVKLSEEQGYAIIPEVVCLRSIDALVKVLSQNDLPRSRAGARHAMKLPPVAAMARDPQLLTIVRAILGKDAFPFRATLFDKSPTANWLVVWHQDTALPLRERRETPGWGPWSVKEGISYAHAPASALEQVVALRVHLDDSNSQNGPLRVLPRTHTRGVLTDEEVHTLSEKIESVNCLVPRGGVLVMRPLVVHASSKSQSEAPRRVLHIEYAAPPILGYGLEIEIA